MKRNFTVLLTILICSVTACQSGQKKDRNMDQETKLKIETTAGDIIVKLDGQKVSGKDDLVSKLQYYESGETIEVVIARADSGEYKEQTVEVTLGSKPASDK